MFTFIIIYYNNIPTLGIITTWKPKSKKRRLAEFKVRKFLETLKPSLDSPVASSTSSVTGDADSVGEDWADAGADEGIDLFADCSDLESETENVILESEIFQH